MPTARSAIRAVLMMGGWLIAALVVLEARSARAIADLRAMNHKRLLEAAVEEHAQKLQAQASELARLRATGGRRRSVDLTPPQGVKPIRTFKFKGELPTILQEEQLRVGVEVGVFTGGFSRWVLEQWPMCTSYSMVDLWAPQEHYRQMDSASLEENLRRMELARRNVEPFAGKATLIRNSSVAAAASFADASVDFVYLDARHTYDAVTEDLEAWWPKLRPGGILAGEDYMDADEVWQATATCNFSPKNGGKMYPWSGCSKWNLPYGSYFACKARKECANATLGSAEAEAIKPPCGSDYSLQADGTRRADHKAVRGAVDDFARRQQRQIQVAYRDNQRAFMWEAWAMRR